MTLVRPHVTYWLPASRNGTGACVHRCDIAGNSSRRTVYPIQRGDQRETDVVTFHSLSLRRTPIANADNRNTTLYC